MTTGIRTAILLLTNKCVMVNTLFVIVGK